MPNPPPIPSILNMGACFTSPSPAERVGEGECRGAPRPNFLAWCTPTRSRRARVVSPFRGSGGGSQVSGAVHPHPLAPDASRLPLQGEVG